MCAMPRRFTDLKCTTDTKGTVSVTKKNEATGAEETRATAPAAGDSFYQTGGCYTYTFTLTSPCG